MNQTPVVFLAFANNDDAYLKNLIREGKIIRDNLLDAHDAGYIELYKGDNTSISDLYKGVSRYQKRIVIFHYGGHANDAALMFEGEVDMETANAAGLANTFKAMPQLQLVFLNGCATYGQVDQLLERGVKAVIATNVGINDSKAQEFSEQFYQALAKENTIGDAFGIASQFMQTKYKKELVITTRKGLKIQRKTKQDLPWGIYYQDETALDWKLPDEKTSFSAVPKTLSTIPKNFSKTIGRSQFIEKLQQQLDRAIKPVVLHGIGGIGKSTVARTLIQDKNYKYKLWVTIEENIESSIVQNVTLMNNLGLTKEIKELNEEAKQRLGFQLAIQKLQELKGNNILIIDNAYETLERGEIVQALASLSNWKILVTSRLQLKSIYFENTQLPYLSMADGIALFQSHHAANATSIQSLLEYIDCHPLLIELMAKTLEKSHNIKGVKELKTYLQTNKLSDEQLDIAVEIADTDAEIRIYQHLIKVFSLSKLTESEQLLIKQIAVLPNDSIAIQHLQLLLQIPFQKHAVFSNTINRLLKFGWINSDIQREIRMHRTIQVLMQNLEPIPDNDICEPILSSLYQIYKKNNPTFFIPFFTQSHQNKFRYIDDAYLLLRRYEKLFSKTNEYLITIVEQLEDLDEHPIYYRLLATAATYHKEHGHYDIAFNLYKYYLDAVDSHDDSSVDLIVDAYKFVIQILLKKSLMEVLSFSALLIH